MGYEIKVRPDGALDVSDELRRDLNMQPGDILKVVREGGAIRIANPRGALRALQEYMRPFKREGVSEVDELIAERRREAMRE